MAIFFILLGFVNALKPIKLARARQPDTALSNLAVSSFRRTFRLVLPATAATILSWTACQLGMFETSKNGDAFWLYTYAPSMSASWGTAIEDLVGALRSTWTIFDSNPYDQPQWAMIYLLLGSIFVFCALLMTINLTPIYRTTILVLLAAWSLDWSHKFNDPLVGITVFSGISLAEFSLSNSAQKLARFSPWISPPLTILALFLMSYPGDYAHTAPWSKALQGFAYSHFPANVMNDVARTYGSIGAILLIFSIVISPHQRNLLSHRVLIWLGKISFPIYLLHGTFMRSVFAWILFTSEPRAYEVRGADGNQYSIERYPQGSNLRVFVAVVVSMGMCLVASHYWAKKVEPLFAKITKFAEDRMTGKGENGAMFGKSILPVRKE